MILLCRTSNPCVYEHLTELIQAFVATLELPDDERARLMAMTPGNYIGKAVELAKRV